MPENQNIIIMAKREDPFSRVSKSMLDDEQLSWRAKGVLSYLLGKPAGWKLRVGDLLNKSKDGKHAVRAALKELREAGYAELRPVRAGGRIVEWCWKISDTAIFSPDTDFQDVENQVLENRHHSKNEGIKNDLRKKEGLQSSYRASQAKQPAVSLRGLPANDDEATTMLEEVYGVGTISSRAYEILPKFIEQMQKANWRIKGERVNDWLKVFEGRVKHAGAEILEP